MFVAEGISHAFSGSVPKKNDVRSRNGKRDRNSLVQACFAFVSQFAWMLVFVSLIKGNNAFHDGAPGRFL